MDLIGYFLTAAALLPAVAQVRHSVRLRTVSGVSGATTLAWVCSWSVWILYGVLIESGPVVAHNVLGLLPAVVLLVVFRRFATLSRPLLVGALYVGAACGMLVSLRWGLLVLVALDVYFYLPSVVEVFRARDLSGVSLAANVTHVALTSSWLTYLVLTGDPIAGIGWAMAVLSYSVIVVRLLVVRRPDADALAPLLTDTPPAVGGVDAVDAARPAPVRVLRP